MCTLSELCVCAVMVCEQHVSALVHLDYEYHGTELIVPVHHNMVFSPFPSCFFFTIIYMR